MPLIPPPHADAYILVVDDSTVNVQLLLGLLEEYGYCNNRGIDDPRWIEPMLEEQLPDLMLLDINMPHLSGHEVLSWLKQRWAEQAPPVIVLTAQTDSYTRSQAFDLGARDFLIKPFDPQEVMQRIRNALQLHFLLKERNDRAALLEYLVEERTAALERLSHEDPVTALPNRHALIDRVAELLGSQQPALVYFLALEGMEDIARLHGYAMSESLCLHLRDRLRERFGTQMTFGVWNSNKWLMIARQPLIESAVSEQAHAILHCIGQPFSLNQARVRLSPRIGISHSDMPHQNAEHLLRLAALALPDSSSGWRLYQSSIEDDLQKRIRVHEALRAALDNQEFSLVYQPKVDLNSGRVIGAEALLRWVHPQLGFVSPADFIPLAEASGDILRIGDWVLEAAITQLEAWFAGDHLPQGFSLAVNVSPVQLTQPRFAGQLLGRLLRSHLPAGALEVEITESGLMKNVDMARAQLQLLARNHVPVAIDDFGTGHSSLAYLKTLPVSVLKIDRAFVSNMDTQPQDRRLAEAVIDMARNFGCITVAEGVEKPEQVEMLIAMGCSMAQGYLYSPPLKAEQFIAFCADSQPQPIT